MREVLKISMDDSKNSFKNFPQNIQTDQIHQLLFIWEKYNIELMYGLRNVETSKKDSDVSLYEFINRR